MRIPSLLLILLSLTLAAARPRPDQKPPADITLQNMKFVPDTLKAKTGQTIVWQNADDRDHAVQADDKSFRSGNLKKGDQFQFTFRKPGKYSYSCPYHPRMKGIILVADPEK